MDIKIGQIVHLKGDEEQEMCVYNISWSTDGKRTILEVVWLDKDKVPQILTLDKDCFNL